MQMQILFFQMLSKVSRLIGLIGLCWKKRRIRIHEEKDKPITIWKSNSKGTKTTDPQDYSSALVYHFVIRCKKYSKFISKDGGMRDHFSWYIISIIE